MAKYKEPNVEQLRFVPINFAELFPEDHPLSQLLSVIQKLDLSDFDASYKNNTAAGGRPATSCQRILAVVVYSLLYGGISMRNLQRELAVRADLLYLSGGMDIDHTTFSVFRKRHREAILRLFGQTVFIGVEAGLIDLDTVCIDSTKIKAWANRRDIGDQEELARRYEHVRELCEKRYAEWEACEEEEEKKKLEKGVARLSRLKTKIAVAFQFLQEHPERKRVHLHERDADWQKDGAKGFVLGYNAELAVDSKNQMIVYENVVTDQSDTYQAVPVVEAVEAVKKEVLETKQDEVKYVLDCGYSSAETLKALQERDVYMPDQQFAKRLGGGKDKPEDRSKEIGPPPVKAKESRFDGQSLEFVYQAAEDRFICPAGGTLSFRREGPLGGILYRRYQKNKCGECALRDRCIRSSKHPTRKDLWIRASDLPGLKAKVVPTLRSPDRISGFELALAMRAKLSMPEGRAVYAKRFPVSEGVFGTVKGLRAGYRFLRCRLERVREEWAERCIAHNLAKLAKFTLCSLMEW
jgi:transposase